jgi:hypothetical protein
MVRYDSRVGVLSQNRVGGVEKDPLIYLSEAFKRPFGRIAAAGKLNDAIVERLTTDARIAKGVTGRRTRLKDRSVEQGGINRDGLGPSSVDGRRGRVAGRKSSITSRRGVAGGDQFGVDEVKADGDRSRRFTKDSDLLRITAKALDVLSDPLLADLAYWLQRQRLQPRPANPRCPHGSSA